MERALTEKVPNSISNLRRENCKSKPSRGASILQARELISLETMLSSLATMEKAKEMMAREVIIEEYSPSDNVDLHISKR